MRYVSIRQRCGKIGHFRLRKKLKFENWEIVCHSLYQRNGSLYQRKCFSSITSSLVIRKRSPGSRQLVNFKALLCAYGETLWFCIHLVESSLCFISFKIWTRITEDHRFVSVLLMLLTALAIRHGRFLRLIFAILAILNFVVFPFCWVGLC